MTKLNIGIIGCGIGGLAAAALLAKQGHNISMFDQFSNPAPVGSGLMVQPVGLEVLSQIGVADRAISLGSKIGSMAGYEFPSNRKVLNVSYGKDFGLAIHRASLFDVLYQQVLTTDCKIHPNAKVAGSELHDDKRTIILDNGKQHGPFDLVIDASGVNSPLSPLKAEALNYGALWGTVDWPENTKMRQDQLMQRYRMASTMAGILPIGILPNGTHQKATIFWSIRQNDYQSWKEQPIEEWKSAVTNLWPEFAPFLTQITSHDDLTMARYKHGNLWNTYEPALVFIGDAAHCASPQLGQGANMALLDALALSKMLQKLPIKKALPAYQKLRRNHVALYQLMSWALTPMYQSDSKIMPWLRNWILAPLSNIPPFPWLLTRTGCGNLIRPIRR
ncbi:MAG: NAD(P)/FAD-dependent oxidoreductase [Rhizobiaceae bacterium]